VERIALQLVVGKILKAHNQDGMVVFVIHSENHNGEGFVGGRRSSEFLPAGTTPVASP
jgi:hypothetical protein